jgi:hypothetical protein
VSYDDSWREASTRALLKRDSRGPVYNHRDGK